MMTQLALSNPALDANLGLRNGQAFGYCFPKQDIAGSQKNAWRVVPFFFFPVPFFLPMLSPIVLYGTEAEVLVTNDTRE